MLVLGYSCCLFDDSFIHLISILFQCSIQLVFLSCRDVRGNRVALFDGIEEGGIRASSSYSHEIDEHDNERAVDGLQERVNILKRVSSRWLVRSICYPD